MVLRTESYRRGFAYSSLLSVVDNILAFVPSVLVAAFFGTQTVTDIYYYCTGLVMLVIAYLNNISVAVVVPEYMRIRIQSGAEDGMRFLNTIWGVSMGLLIGLMVCVVSNPVRFVGLISRFPQSALEQHRAILFWAIPLLPLQAIVGSMNDVLHSHKFFAIPMMSSITNRVVVIAALLLGWRRIGILSMLIGLQASFLLQVVLLMYLLRSRLHWSWKTGWGKVRKETWRNAAFSALGGLASLGASYVPLMLFTGLPAGEVTGLNIAQRLVGLPMAFLAGQAAAVMGIKMNEVFARRDMEVARHTFENVSLLLVLAMSMLSAALWLLAPDMIAVLYQRGAFDEKSTAITASLLGVLVWSLPALGMNALVARVFMAGQRIREAFWCQMVGNIIQISAVTWAVRHWGGIGYPAALVAFYAVYLISLAPVIAHLFPALGYWRVLERAALMVGMAAGVAGCFRFVLSNVDKVMTPWLRMVIVGPLVIAAILGLNYFLPVCMPLRALVTESWERVRGAWGRGVERRGAHDL